jgi:hypothetical protein
LQTWEESDWDKPGYNPKNGKIRALFRWEVSNSAPPAPAARAESVAFRSWDAARCQQ